MLSEILVEIANNELAVMPLHPLSAAPVSSVRVMIG